MQSDAMKGAAASDGPAPHIVADVVDPTTVDPGLRRVALLFLFLISMFNYIDRTILSILQEPIKREFGLSDGQLGLLTGLSFALFYATMAVPIARIADRSNRRNLVAGSLGLWSAMTALSGLATNFASLLVLRIGVALGEAGSVPASHSIIADYYPPDRRTTALALWGLALPFGIMLGYGLGGGIAAALGWRMAFAVVGAAGLLLVPLVIWFVREPGRTIWNAQRAVDDSPIGVRDALLTLWRLRTYRYLLIGGALQGFAHYAVQSWMAPFYLRSHGMTIERVAFWLALMSGLGGGLGMYLGGRLSDAAGRRWPSGRVWVAAIGLLLMVPCTLVQLLTPSLALSLSFGFVGSTLMLFYYAPIVAVPQSLVPARMRAMTSAVTLLVFNLFGLGLGPTLTGFLSDLLTRDYALGTEALRYAMASVLVFSIAGAGSMLHASRFYEREAIDR